MLRTSRYSIKMDAEPSTLRQVMSSELARGVNEGVFPGASACVARYEAGQWQRVYAVAGKQSKQLPVVHTNTVYDLASLTKPFMTMLALSLIERGVFSPEDRIDAWLPELSVTQLGTLPIETLFTHRSGLEAWFPFYEHAAEDLESARARVFTHLPSLWSPERVGQCLYSDLGFIAGGIWLERLCARSLEKLLQQYVLGPLGLEKQVVFPAYFDVTQRVRWQCDVAPGSYSPWRRYVAHAEVDDDNCAWLGGVAAHAGLFGTAESVATFGCAAIDAYRGRSAPWSQSAIERMLSTRPKGTYSFGWDSVSREGSMTGRHFSAESFGHLGFTGTSLWCDPKAQIVVVLLSNRVHPSRDNLRIRDFRPRFHDALYKRNVS